MSPFNNSRWRRMAALFSLISLAAGCTKIPTYGEGEHASVGEPPTVATSGRVFSAQEQRAARSLSLGSDTTLPGSKSPYEMAATCLVAIDYLVEKMRAAGALSKDYSAAMNQAKSTYERRAVAQEGRDRVGLARDIAKIRQSYADNSQDLGRLGLGCIQRLM